MPATAGDNDLYIVFIRGFRPDGCTADLLQVVSGNSVNVRARSIGSVQIGYNTPPYTGGPKAGPVTFCPGQEFQLYAGVNNNNGDRGRGFNYTWSGLESGFDPLVDQSSNPTNNRIVRTTARTAGVYTAVVRPNFPTSTGCASTASASLQITVQSSAEKPVVQGTGGGSVCEGGSSTLSLANTCSGTVTWSTGGTNIGTGNSIVVKPAVTTDYVATCTTTGNCGGSSASEPFKVTVIPTTFDVSIVGVTESSPDKGPIVGQAKVNLQNGDVLSFPARRMWTVIANTCPQANAVEMHLTGPGISFKTVENTAPMALFNNNGPTIFSTINDPVNALGPAFNNGWPTGAYTLAINIRDQDGLPLEGAPKNRTPQGNIIASKTVNFSVADPGGRLAVVDAEATRNVRVWPNPATTQVSVEVNTGVRQPVRVQLTDLQGRTLYQKATTADSNLYREQIDLGQQPAGMYLLNVTTNGRVERMKVIKIAN